MSKSFFTKQETIVLIILFLVVFVVTGLNMRVSLRLARDAQRKGDLGAMTDALEKFRNEIGFLPPSENGKIKMCKGVNFDQVMAELKRRPLFDKALFESGLRACEWGKDGLIDILHDDNPTYMTTIPSDPLWNKGYHYTYLASSERFQIYSYLEGGQDESGYDPKIVARNLDCGPGVCSFGRSWAVPVDRDIHEYEEELLKAKP